MISSSLYDNITISGGPGSGKSLLSTNLRKILEPEGWHFLHAGEIMRKDMNEFINPSADLLPDDSHIIIDQRAHEILSTRSHYVIDAWLAGFIARDLPRTLRVLLYMSDPDEAVNRVAQRDNLSTAEARQLMKDREERNVKVWRKIYGDVDFWNPEYYNLLIDSCHSTPEQSVQSVMDALKC
jgi:cytidylate kinase